jgi:rhamnosyltransferase
VQLPKLKIAATVIIYNPDENVIFNIKSYSGYFDTVYVFDNSTNTSSIQKRIATLDNIEFFQDFENKGIAERLNSASKKASENNFEWLLTMDQDSFFEDGMFEKYLQLFSAFENRNSVAQFGCNNKEKGSNTDRHETGFVQTELMITSGSLLNLSANKIIGEFDTAYFIDQVDNDYCIRSLMANYTLIHFPNIYITHQFGNKVKRASIKTLYLIKKYKVVHPPLRCYYIYRNLLYFLKKFEGQKFEAIQHIKKYTTHYLKQSQFYNGFYWKTKKYIAKAKKDFVEKRMGKIDVEF